MFAEWLEDLESLEAISQDAEARTIFSRMAAMSQEGRLGTFLIELAGTPDLDDFTKGTLSEIARDEAFLLTVDDYLYRTQESFQFDGGIWASSGSHRKTSDWRLLNRTRECSLSGGRLHSPLILVIL